MKRIAEKLFGHKSGGDLQQDAEHGEEQMSVGGSQLFNVKTRTNNRNRSDTLFQLRTNVSTKSKALPLSELENIVAGGSPKKQRIIKPDPDSNI